MRRIAEEDLRFKSCNKSSTNALRALKLSGNMGMFWSKEFWPPNSPDLNPMDYYVWSVIEQVTNKSRYPNMTSFPAAIEVFANMDKDALQRAYQRFMT